MAGDENSSEDYTKKLEQAYEEIKSQNKHLLESGSYPVSNISEDNLIKWQLDMGPDLEKIHHLLKGSIRTMDAQHNVIYKEPTDEKSKPFTDHGVQTLMTIVQFYMNRNTLLSYYDDETIKWKMLDIGRKIKNLIFTKYENMMMPDKDKLEELFIKDNPRYTSEKLKEANEFIDRHPDDLCLGIDIYEIDDEELQKEYEKHKKILNDYVIFISDLQQYKIKMYPMIVQELVDSIHSAYLRARSGGERESLRKNIHYTQSDNIMNRYGGMQQPMQNNRSLLRPKTWMK